MDQIRIATTVALLGGLWLAASPFVLGYTDNRAALAVSLGGGLLYMILALARLFRPRVEAPAWAMIGVAFIMMLAPMTFGYYALRGAINSQLAIAVGIMAMAVWSIFASDRSWPREHVFSASEPANEDRPPHAFEATERRR